MKSCLTAIILAILLSACAAPGNVNAPANVTPSPTPVATVSPAVEPASTPRPDEAGDAKEDKFQGTAGITDKKARPVAAVVLAAIRTGTHGKFDRVVFEFSGSAMPGYHIEYIDKPVRSCGSGEVVPLAGDAWLEIRMTPAAAHTEQGQPTIKTRSFSPNLPIVKELKSTCDFEADVAWVAGVSTPNEYRVLELKDPARLVVDISH